jgi:hypothetical protein
MDKPQANTLRKKKQAKHASAQTYRNARVAYVRCVVLQEMASAAADPRA